MKRIVSLLVALCVLCGSVPRIDRGGFLPIQETKAPAPGPAPVVFIIGCTVIAGLAVWYIWVSLKAPAPGGTYYWALQKSTDHVNWTTVANTTLRMTEDHAWDAFEITRDKDGAAFYRMVLTNYIPVNPLWDPPQIFSSSSMERPVFQGL